MFADLYWNREWLERYPAEIDRLFEAHAEALRLVREARARPRCDWGPAWASPLTSMLPDTTLASQRELAKAVCSAAWLHHARGHDGEAVERWRDGLVFASRMGDPAQFLIGYLFGAACNGLASRHAASVAPGLRIAADDVSVHSGRGPATRSQVVQLIADLLDERGLLRSWDDAILGERILQLDMLDNLQTGRQLVGAGATAPPTRVEVALGAILAPARRHLGLEMLAFYGDVRSAGHAALWSQAHSGVDWSWADQSLHWSNLAIPGGVAGLAGNLEAVLRIHFQHLADRRLAATAVAIRLYQVDHGRRPATLDELVPEYLPAVPIDPFTANGSPIRYLPDGTPPRLYSIGEDGVDDGAPMRQATRGGWWSWHADIVVILESPLAATATRPASEQAPDDEPGVEQGAAEHQGQQQQPQRQQVQQDDPAPASHEADVPDAAKTSVDPPLPQDNSENSDQHSDAETRPAEQVRRWIADQDQSRDEERQPQRQPRHRTPAVITQRDRPVLLLERLPAGVKEVARQPRQAGQPHQGDDLRETQPQPEIGRCAPIVEGIPHGRGD